MAVATFTKSGTKATTAASLNKLVFEVEIKNHELLKEAYVAYLANGRGSFAVTKTRGLVRGGGKKPWKQKGTGRARFGSSRNPIWRGGGIVFGPTGLENYTKQMNLKSKRLAVRQALTMAHQESKIKVIELFDCAHGKVAETAKLLKKLDANGSTLIIVSNKDAQVIRATRNLKSLKVVPATYLSTYDVMNADSIVFEKAALAATTEWLTKELLV